MEEIRLNKFLSEIGVCSRREADRLAEGGRILIDKKPAVMGQKVTKNQEITVDGKVVWSAGQGGKEPEPVLLAVNKPRGIVCTTSQKDKAENIVEFLHYPERIYPMGRLDKDSEGLIFMTNQGELVNKIMRSGNAHEKEYQVTVNKPVTRAFAEKMAAGVEILDTVTRPCQVKITGKYAFTIILTQGLNRQIRRMCEALGYQVMTLKRTRIMNIHLGNLKTGTWRKVTEEEYKTLLKQLENSSCLPYSERKKGETADGK